MNSGTSSAGYKTADVARLLDVSGSQIRSWVRSGWIDPRRGTRGEYRFSFQDLVLLRTAKGLVEARIPARRVGLALERLRDQLPPGRSLTSVRITADGRQVLVRDGSELWEAESGQAVFDFQVSDLARSVKPLARQAVAQAREEKRLDADGWYELGCELETASMDEAMDAYRHALELDGQLAEALLNMGRLLHERGHLKEAADHYHRALSLRPDDVTAAFNLGVALQDLDKSREAIQLYRLVLRLDPTHADAHYNLAGVYVKLRQPEAALRHLKAYRKLVRNV